MGKIIGFNGADNTYQVMVNGESDSYKSNVVKKFVMKKHKTDKKKLKHKKDIKAKDIVQINKPQ